MNWGHIFCGGHNVIGHLIVGHVAVLPNDFFVERVSDALRDTTFDLSAGEDGIEHAAHLLHRPEVFHLGGIRDRVHGHLRNLNGPGIGGISFAAIFLIVPENVGRRFIAA